MSEKKPAVQTVACEVLRDFWDKDGERIVKGTIVDLDPMDAIDLIEAKRIRKVK